MKTNKLNDRQFEIEKMLENTDMDASFVISLDSIVDTEDHVVNRHLMNPLYDY